MQQSGAKEWKSERLLRCVYWHCNENIFILLDSEALLRSPTNGLTTSTTRMHRRSQSYVPSIDSALAQTPLPVKHKDDAVLSPHEKRLRSQLELVLSKTEPLPSPVSMAEAPPLDQKKSKRQSLQLALGFNWLLATPVERTAVPPTRHTSPVPSTSADSTAPSCPPTPSPKTPASPSIGIGLPSSLARRTSSTDSTLTDGSPSKEYRPFNPRTASLQCAKMEGLVSFNVVEGLGEPLSPGTGDRSSLYDGDGNDPPPERTRGWFF